MGWKELMSIYTRPLEIIYCDTRYLEHFSLMVKVKLYPAFEEKILEDL